MSFAVAAGATVALIGGIIGGSKARRAKEASERKAANLERRMKGIKRQEITNPYEGVKDLSSMINNPYANLQVATKAAEIRRTAALYKAGKYINIKAIQKSRVNQDVTKKSKKSTKRRNKKSTKK